MVHEKRVAKAYNREMLGSLAIYVVLLVAALRIGRTMPEGVLRTLVLASPMLGFGLALWAIARHLGRIDEYVRLRLLENLAIAAAITAGLTFTYGFLEIAGYPRLSMFSVWCVLCGAFIVVQCVRKLMSR